MELTNKEAKQKVIEKAYGEFYEKLKNFIDEDGFLYERRNKEQLPVKLKYINHAWNDPFDQRFFLGHIPMRFIPTGNPLKNRAIPFSIENIEYNNGWVRIQPDGCNLPTETEKLFKVGSLKDNGDFDIIGYGVTANFLKNLLIKSEFIKITHYKEIEKDRKPIY